MTAQEAEILKLQDQLKRSQEVSDLYREQAVQDFMVLTRQRHRPASSDNDNLTLEQLLHQISLARVENQVLDRTLEQLQLQEKQLKSSFEQILTLSPVILALHVTLRARPAHKPSSSAS